MRRRSVQAFGHVALVFGLALVEACGGDSDGSEAPNDNAGVGSGGRAGSTSGGSKSSGGSIGSGGVATSSGGMVASGGRSASGGGNAVSGGRAGASGGSPNSPSGGRPSVEAGAAGEPSAGGEVSTGGSNGSGGSGVPSGGGSNAGASSAGEAGAPSRRLCGGFAGFTCDEADEYCAYEEGAYCGAADASAWCEPRPSACTKEFVPVCGCDQQTYSNACEAARAGTGVYQAGECE